MVVAFARNTVNDQINSVPWSTRIVAGNPTSRSTLSSFKNIDDICAAEGKS